MAKPPKQPGYATKRDLIQLESRLSRRLVDLEARFDKRLQDLESRFNRHLLELEGRLETRFDKRLRDFELRLNTKIDTLTTAVDRMLVFAEKRDQEVVSINHRLERHEAWIAKLAGKVGVKLEGA